MYKCKNFTFKGIIVMVKDVVEKATTSEYIYEYIRSLLIGNVIISYFLALPV